MRNCRHMGDRMFLEALALLPPFARGQRGFDSARRLSYPSALNVQEPRSLSGHALIVGRPGSSVVCHARYVQQNMRHTIGQFLVEVLWLSWVDGEQWFHETLADCDVAINAMMWQHQARLLSNRPHASMRPHLTAGPPHKRMQGGDAQRGSETGGRGSAGGHAMAVASAGHDRESWSCRS